MYNFIGYSKCKLKLAYLGLDCVYDVIMCIKTLRQILLIRRNVFMRMIYNVTVSKLIRRKPTDLAPAPPRDFYNPDSSASLALKFRQVFPI